MANQTNIHKEMDKILQKLATLEANDKGLAKQANYLTQLVVPAKQDSACQHQEFQINPEEKGYGHAGRARYRRVSPPTLRRDECPSRIDTNMPSCGKSRIAA